MKIAELFDDEKIVVRIQERLPLLFHLAELESSCGGKVGMEVGSIREKIIIALLICKFGENTVFLLITGYNSNPFHRCMDNSPIPQNL